MARDSDTAAKKAIRLWTASKGDGHSLRVTNHDDIELCSLLNRVISGDTEQVVADARDAAIARPVLDQAARFAAIANRFLTIQRRLASDDLWRALPWHAAGEARRPYRPWDSAGAGAEPSFTSYRGTSIPAEQLPFFIEGKQVNNRRSPYPLYHRT